MLPIDTDALLSVGHFGDAAEDDMAMVVEFSRFSQA
jgi:hypothetical protein